MILPATFLVGLFTIYPFAQAIYLSFVKYITYKPDEIGVFVGLGNFIGATQESFFAESVLNTLWFTGISVLVITLAGLGVAMVLSQKFKGASLVTSIMLVSWAIPPATAGLMWRHMLQSTGWINKILVDLGVWQSPVYFLSMPKVVQILFAVVAQLWQQLPFATLLLLATMQLVPKSVLDSAAMDGAGGFSKFKDVILPFIRPAGIGGGAFLGLLSPTKYDLVFTLSGGQVWLVFFFSFSLLFNLN